MVRLVRHDLRLWLEAQGVPAEVVNEVTLACSEACANAVEHPAAAARQAFEVEARLGSRELVVRVRDFGSWNESARSDLRGRGLRMIRELMDSVDLYRGAAGTRIVMRHSLGGQRAAAGPTIGST
jgi:serine/threonine-protein kinase RsbW